MRVVDHASLGNMRSGSTARATLVLIRLLVVDQKLALLSVAVRLLSSYADHREDGVGLAEDGVHLLQRPVGGLGVEEVHDREDDGVAGPCQSRPYQTQAKLT